MKTTARIFSPFNNQPLCESTLRSLFSRCSSWARGLFTPVRMTLLIRRLRRTIAPALRAALAGLSALSLSIDSKVNFRVFAGLVLMGVVAPLAACFYLLFNRVDFVENWYHVNYFHLFFLLGPHLFIFFCLAGAFLLFPEGSKRAYLLAVPTGYNVAKIIWLTMATSNQDFWAVVPLSIILIGMLISVVLFLALDWFAHNKFHKEDAFDARLTNLIKLADDFDDAKFKSMVKSVWREKSNFQKQY